MSSKRRQRCKSCEGNGEKILTGIFGPTGERFSPSWFEKFHKDLYERGWSGQRVLAAGLKHEYREFYASHPNGI